MSERAYHHVRWLVLITAKSRWCSSRYKQREIQGYPLDCAVCMAQSYRGEMGAKGIIKGFNFNSNDPIASPFAASPLP